MAESRRLAVFILLAVAGLLLVASSGSEGKSLRHMGTKAVINEARASAFRNGLYGACAGMLQVMTLMWLRTAVNYQYRYGVSLSVALSTLYAQGGIARFYQGFFFAIIQGPLCKFGAVAANEGAKVLASVYASPKYATVYATTLGSALSVFWRFLLMPIDTCKTVLQVEGSAGLATLFEQVFRNGRISALYQGSLATMLSTFVANYPWFYVYNALDRALVVPKLLQHAIVRGACMGFVASLASDTVSNTFRVIKTVKQATIVVGDATAPSYIEIITSIIATDGLSGLFFRGLSSRILTNALQSVIFTVLLKILPLYIGSSVASATKDCTDKNKGKGSETRSKLDKDDSYREPRYTV